MRRRPIRWGITRVEYDRRWNAIMHAFYVGALTPEQASAAVGDLTNNHIWHVPTKRRKETAMAKLKVAKWTLVQHSGHQHDEGFSTAVEEAAIRTEGEEARVRKLGGVVFETYREASSAEYAENYPAEVSGMYPRVRGTFARTGLIDGRRIYIPAQAS